MPHPTPTPLLEANRVSIPVCLYYYIISADDIRCLFHAYNVDITRILLVAEVVNSNYMVTDGCVLIVALMMAVMVVFVDRMRSSSAIV